MLIPFEPFEINSGVFYTGGIGDILATEAFLSLEQRCRIETIYYACNKSKVLIELFTGHSGYPNLKKNHVIWDDFSKFWCLWSKGGCNKLIQEHKKIVPAAYFDSTDLSIASCFPKLRNSHYFGSSFLKHKMCDIDAFDLPKSYFVICPYSTDKREKARDFSNRDWAATFSILSNIKSKGVILNTGNDKCPMSDSLINLTNKTTIKEAIEILKGADGYVGVDSSLSVLAAKLFNYPNLLIKSTNKHLINWKDIYYAPHTDFNFIQSSVQIPPSLLHRSINERHAANFDRRHKVLNSLLNTQPQELHRSSGP